MKPDHAVRIIRRFGVFEADLSARELRRSGVLVHLQDQPFEMLAVLLKRPGELVTRAELGARLWTDGTFVDFEAGLNTTAKKLRDALGDQAENPRFIQTLPRRGYRFIAPVQCGSARSSTVPVWAWKSFALLALAATVGWWSVGRAPKSIPNPGGAAAIASIAVLPFSNASGDPSADYLSEGLSESLIRDLSRISRLKVKSRDTVFRYRSSGKEIRQVGRDLGVDAVLKGRLVKQGDLLSIRIELVDTGDATVLWSEHYSRRMGDLPAIEADVAQRICEQLRLELSRQDRQRLAVRAYQNAEAHRLYLQGRYYWNRRTEQNLKRSARLFEQVIEREPGHARAWAGLADSLVLQASYSYIRPLDAYPQAWAAARKAIELDPDLAEAHTSMAWLTVMNNWDWAAAEHGFRSAIERGPDYATAHHWYALYLVTMNRANEAIAEIERARDLEPFSPVITAQVGTVYYYVRQYAQAEKEFRRARELDHDYSLDRADLGLTYALLGKKPDALSEFERVLKRALTNPSPLAMAGCGFGFLGHTEQASRILERLEKRTASSYVGPQLQAVVFAGMGKGDLAFAFFEKALDERSITPFWLRNPVFDGIRSDPRFQKLLRRMELAP